MVYIITGHYGAGKTNFATNLALKLSESEKTAVCDLDVVNPYFRTADFKTLFEEHGIELLASIYANTNVDTPAISFDLSRVVADGVTLVVDVGGDDEGAKALGRYKDVFQNYEMLYVVNFRRYLTLTAEEAYNVMKEIEAASGFSHTGIVNNTNLGEENTEAIFTASKSEADRLSSISGLPVKYECTPENTRVYVKKIWNN
ncbi:MAG: cobalamin biosynthesis protein CobQ [Ruminococcus sp.]|jgi:hypothetical protein|nr:cobalamin biosynthesis protein CobQ [Ruminococcus sp.]